MIGIYHYSEMKSGEIFMRGSQIPDIRERVLAILNDVRERGDRALYDLTEKFDKVRPESLAVSEEETREALSLVEPEFLDVMKKAEENIRAFHSGQVRQGFSMTNADGVTVGQRIIPVESAGLYVPGGTAAYPSTVLMDAVPAKIAGCKNLVITTPPGKDGKVRPAILAAAKIAGVDRIFKIGGAQAIAALAFGTESVPKVDKIVGPGNAYVAEAKNLVRSFGLVSVDMIAGPSEILIVADGRSDEKTVAADLLSQAEHDKMASAVLVTDSERLAEKVREEIERQLATLPRHEIARGSIEANGKIIVADSIDQAIEIANELAPEHLEICVDDPFPLLEKVKNAGSVFLGRNCPEALGDYLAGPNHTLPTSGTARFASPLSVDDFVKKSQFIYCPPGADEGLFFNVAKFAEKEGLSGHARSALSRVKNAKIGVEGKEAGS